MSAPNVANFLRLPGKLSHSPTDLSAAYPHGGTAIATVTKLTPNLLDAPFLVRGAEFGNAVMDLVEGGPQWSVDMVLSEILDAAALAAIFPCYVVGRSGGPILKYTATTTGMRAGTSIGAALAVVLVYTPDNADEHPWLILRRAIPSIKETAELALRGNEFAGIPVRWYATPNASLDVFDFGLRRDVTL